MVFGSAEQALEQRDQHGADERHSAARHQLLDALGLLTRRISEIRRQRSLFYHGNRNAPPRTAQEIVRRIRERANERSIVHRCDENANMVSPAILPGMTANKTVLHSQTKSMIVGRNDTWISLLVPLPIWVVLA